LQQIGHSFEQWGALTDHQDMMPVRFHARCASLSSSAPLSDIAEHPDCSKGIEQGR
jgi:hypothetical protein